MQESFDLMKKELVEFIEGYIKIFGQRSLIEGWYEPVLKMQFRDFEEQLQLQKENLENDSMFSYVKDALDIAFDELIPNVNYIQIDLEQDGIELLVLSIPNQEVLYRRTYGLFAHNICEITEILDKEISKEHWLFIVLFQLNLQMPTTMERNL